MTLDPDATMRPATRPHPGPAPAPPVSDGPPLGEPPQVPPPARRGAPGDDIQARCEQAGVEQVELQYTDLAGRARTVSVPARRVGQVIRDGEVVDRAAVDDGGDDIESELLLRADIATFRLISRPGQPSSARLVCNAQAPGGTPHEVDTRGALARVLAGADAAGYEYHVGVEIEFFLFPAAAAGPSRRGDDRAARLDLDPGAARQVEADIVTGLEALGVEIESGHHELQSRQHHISLPMQPAMAAADAIATLKPAVKEIAARRNLAASFMPKPRNNAPSSAMHVQQVLFGVAPGAEDLRPVSRAGGSAPTNAFHGAGPDGLSPQARWFIAGQLHHAAALCAVVAPLVNSYKRLLSPGEEMVSGWGRQARSVVLRVVAGPDGQDTRLELRLPDASSNPYLAFASMLAAGLDGIREELEPEPAIDSPATRTGQDLTYRRPLPATLGEALVFIRHDAVLEKAVGAELLTHFTRAKDIEWAEYSRQVTQWELDSYLHSY